MAFNKRVLLCMGIGFAAIMSTAQIAHAGGCFRRPGHGDYLDCSNNGPYGPSGKPGLQCTTQCVALKNCLNSSHPPPPCTAQHQAFLMCTDPHYVPPVIPLVASGAGSEISANSVTLGFEDGVGCFLIDSGTSASTERRPITSAIRQPDSVTSDRQAECLVLSDERSGAVQQESTRLMLSVIAKRLGVSSARLTSDADLYADLGASWEDMRAVANDFEELFSVKVTDEVINNLNTVGDVINCAEQASIAGVF